MTVEEKLISGQTVYMFCEHGMHGIHECVAMLIPGEEYTIVKFKGGKPYGIKDTTNLATDCRLFGKEITKEEFDKY